MQLKIVSILKKKDKIVKKLKARFGEGTVEGEDDDEEEAKQYHGPLSLTPGMGEDVEEKGFKEEDAKEAPTKLQPKKRKASTKPVEKSKKATKTSPTNPTTRANTRAITQKAKE